MTSLYYRGPRENWNRTIHLHRENQESASSRIPRLLLGQALVSSVLKMALETA